MFKVTNRSGLPLGSAGLGGLCDMLPKPAKGNPAARQSCWRGAHQDHPATGQGNSGRQAPAAMAASWSCSACRQVPAKDAPSAGC